MCNSFVRNSKQSGLSLLAASLQGHKYKSAQSSELTAKHNKRIYVVHNYHDHANEPDSGVSVNAKSFPYKLHMALEAVHADGLSHIVSWQPHGRCFSVHDSKKFINEVMPRYFNQTKLTSFQRQLNLYGFQRLTHGADAGGYYHELFLRSKVHLINGMVRTKVKGTGYKAASSPEDEPGFYRMSPVGSSGMMETSNLQSPSIVTHSDNDESDISLDSADSPPRMSASSVDLLNDVVLECPDIDVDDMQGLDDMISDWDQPIESDDQLMECLSEFLWDDDEPDLPQSYVSV